MALFSRFSRYQLYSWGLFCLIFIYLLLRAAIVEPIHDEVATFFHYIETGRIFGEDIVQDANNHLMNSYIGRFIYHFTGDRFFFLRLPNVLSFILYFFGIVRLIRSLEPVWLRAVLLTALTSIPYMDDYFAYTRGYGLAIGFFVWVLVYANAWLKEPRIRNAALLYACAYLCVFANLIYLVSACMVLALIGFVHLVNIRRFSWKKQLILFGLHLAFLAALYPFVWFSYLLKMGGALYYGSLDGFWEVTGKTLTRYVLFYDADWQRWLLLAIIGAFAVLLIVPVVRKGLRTQIEAEESTFGYFFFGNIAAIFILAKVMKVNYPEDRAGMYLIPLFLLLFGFFVARSPKTRPAALLLLFFPLTFLWKLNLSTSVFSPDDRMNTELYKAVRRQVTPESTISIYPLMTLTLALHERSQHGARIQPDNERQFVPFYDIILLKTKEYPSDKLKEYDIIYWDRESTHIAYKRKKPLPRKKVSEYRAPDTRSSDAEFIPILNLQISDTLRGKILVTGISGKLQIDSIYNEVNVVVSTFNAKGEPVRYKDFHERWMHSAKTLKFPVNIHHMLKKFTPEETELRIYIWNPRHRKVSFTGGRTTFSKLVFEK